MSALLTSTQVTAVDQFPHRLVVNDVPFEMPIHPEPPCSKRPVMSASPLPLKSSLPSPLKSPPSVSTQVTAELQVAHRVVLNEESVDRAVHHWPPCSQRPVMSALPSPLKSPTFTSTQVTAGLQFPHRVLVK